MTRKVVLSRTAKKKLSGLFDFLVENWSRKAKSDFVKKLDKSIEIIKTQPESFPESEKKVGLRKCVVTKQTTLYYRYNSKRIDIVTIFDTRQDPGRLKKDLK